MLFFVPVQFRDKAHLETEQHEVESVERVIKMKQISIIRYDQEQSEGPQAPIPTLRKRFIDSNL